jgi:hypothetical protein
VTEYDGRGSRVPGDTQEAVVTSDITDNYGPGSGRLHSMQYAPG